MIKGYSVVLKKSVPMHNPKINKNGNRYMAKGTDKDGNTMVAIISESVAREHLRYGHAKKGSGW